MFNPHLPVVDAWVIALNLVGVTVSVVVNWWAGRHGLFRFRPVHSTVAALSLLYVAGYAWLLLTDVEVARWSSVLRGLSLLAWVVVWIAPAVVSLRASKELHAAIRQRQEDDK